MALVAFALFGLALNVSAAEDEDAKDGGAEFFNRLATHVQSIDSVDEKAQAIIADAVASYQKDLADPEADAADPESLVIEILALMSPEFREALDGYDENGASPENGAAMKKLTESADPYLHHNANLFLVRQLVELEELIEAEERITEIFKDIDAYNTHAFGEPDLLYMLGYCQLHNLKHDEAKRTLEDFLIQFPDASPRFVVTAKQMLAELARRVPESIGEVADLMSFSHKRLAAADTGEQLQSAQLRVIELLDTLIEETEKQEQQQQSNPDSQPSQPQDSPQQQNPSEAPPDDAQSPKGGSMPPGKMAGRRVNPGDAWGSMPQADRDKVLQVLRDRFPGRYRVLVEQYYESLAEQP
jgi:tetratricopeptide (TPR) repeat protein